MDQFQDNILNEQPRNTVEFSKLPKPLKLGQKAQYSMVENTEIILPTTGSITYAQNNHIKYTVALQGPNLRFLVGPATYHQCSITFADTAAVTNTGRFDSISNSMFKEWTLRASNELEDIDNSHILLNCLLDVLVNKYDRNTYYSFFGAESCFGTTRTAFNARDGYMFIVAETQYFNQLVVSGIIGMNQSKLLPL